MKERMNDGFSIRKNEHIPGFSLSLSNGNEGLFLWIQGKKKLLIVPSSHIHTHTHRVHFDLSFSHPILP